jgi:hypothetical protein
VRLISHYPHCIAVTLDESALLEELDRALNLPDVLFGRTRPGDINAAIRKSFLSRGWASSVKLPGSNLSVSFVRGNAAMCVQLGNMSRMYADLLKLQTMFRSDRCKLALEVVPSLDAATVMGSNHANYDRLRRELKLFALTITCPMLVLEVGN